MADSRKNTDIGDDVKRMASLAKLKFDPSELGTYADKAKAVLSYVDQLNELDTSGIEPTSHAVEMQAHLRKDEVIRSDIQEEILDVAPARDGKFIQVPKIIDQ
ncbi:MAG: Asp-tRNA(Asn)/Glu-tRNA(Gln) amidotransferase subunit GatC [Pseudomonadota bacterium]